MPYLVQILLPAYDNEGAPFGGAAFGRVRPELTGESGGVTAYTRAPADGTSEEPSGATRREGVVIIEVLCDALDRQWWEGCAASLAARFRQRELVVGALSFESRSATSAAARTDA